jgi:hypothetical protein
LYFAQQYATTALGSQHMIFLHNLEYLFISIYIIINPIYNTAFVHSKLPEYTGFAFMGIFFKMMASVVFLIPLIQARERN